MGTLAPKTLTEVKLGVSIIPVGSQLHTIRVTSIVALRFETVSVTLT
jgi:hypothetical protein